MVFERIHPNRLIARNMQTARARRGLYVRALLARIARWAGFVTRRSPRGERNNGTQTITPRAGSQ